MKNYELKLTSKDFFQMAAEMEKFQKNLEKAKVLILKALADYTKERIQYYISETVGLTGYEVTGELLNSIMISDIVQDTIRVYSDSAYAKFVEYGTGIVGASNPHPEIDNWKYDTNAHGEQGWKYLGKDGEWHWTKGEVAHKFIYNAFQDLKQNYLRIAKETLKKEGIF